MPGVAPSVVVVGNGPRHPDRLALDGDAALALDVHPVEVLRAHAARSSTTPVSCSIRSASVDLPWSMWAMMQKFRMIAGSVRPGRGAAAVRTRTALELGVGDAPSSHAATAANRPAVPPTGARVRTPGRERPDATAVLMWETDVRDLVGGRVEPHRARRSRPPGVSVWCGAAAGRRVLASEPAQGVVTAAPSAAGSRRDRVTATDLLVTRTSMAAPRSTAMTSPPALGRCASPSPPGLGLSVDVAPPACSRPDVDRPGAASAAAAVRGDPRLEQPTRRPHAAIGELPPVGDAFCAARPAIRKAGSQEAFRAVDHDAVSRWPRLRGCAGALRAHRRPDDNSWSPTDGSRLF